MALDEPADDDIKKKHEELTFVFNEKLSKLLSDVDIDYDDSVWGAGFTIKSSIGLISRLQIYNIPNPSGMNFSSGLC